MGIIIPIMGNAKKHGTLEAALFSKVQGRILAILFTRDDQSFYTNEIIRLINCGSGVVQRELQKLTLSGLVTLQQVGNQKRYQANHASPIFSELRAIVIKTFGLADVVRNALLPIAEKIHIAFIYGSIAKQDSNAQSDIDLMLLGDTISYTDVFPLLENASAQLHRPVNPTIYSPIEWTQKVSEGNNFLTRTLEQAKIFLIGNENELRTIGELGQSRPTKSRASQNPE